MSKTWGQKKGTVDKVFGFMVSAIGYGGTKIWNAGRTIDLEVKI